MEAGAWGEGNKTEGPSVTAPSTKGLGMADRERVGARFGGSEINYNPGHAAPPEAVWRFLSSGTSYPDISKTFGKPFRSSRFPQGHPTFQFSAAGGVSPSHTQTQAQAHAQMLLPPSPPELFASYPMVTSIFYFLKTRQFKRRKCSKLAHGKKWQKETMPLYQASNSRAGKGVSIQYVPDS